MLFLQLLLIDGFHQIFFHFSSSQTDVILEPERCGHIQHDQVSWSLNILFLFVYFSRDYDVHRWIFSKLFLLMHLATKMKYLGFEVHAVYLTIVCAVRGLNLDVETVSLSWQPLNEIFSFTIPVVILTMNRFHGYVFTDTMTPRLLTESLKMTQRARFLEKFKAAKVLNNLDS